LIKSAIFVVVMSMVLFFVSIELGGFRFNPTRDYKAVFPNATQLIGGDPVLVNGVKVGSVTQVSLHHNTQAAVSFKVDDDVVLPATTEASIRYRNLTGDLYMELNPGDDVDSTTARLLPGGTIPPSRTHPALDLDVLLGGLKPLFQGLDHEQINRLSSELVAVLQGEGGTVRSILARTASFTSTLAERDEVIGRTIKNLNAVLANLDTHSEELSETIMGLNAVASGLAKDRGRLGSSFNQVDSLTSSVNYLLSGLRGPFKQTVTEVGRVATLINQGRSVVDDVLQKLPGFYLRIGRLGARGPGYNLYICGVRVRLSGGDGNPIMSPWIGPDPNVKRCQWDAAPGETEADRERQIAAEQKASK
jgi:phospholipid/cholesterol/gamma-HCH transport system substrate-binding protein